MKLRLTWFGKFRWTAMLTLAILFLSGLWIGSADLGRETKLLLFFLTFSGLAVFLYIISGLAIRPMQTLIRAIRDESGDKIPFAPGDEWFDLWQSIQTEILEYRSRANVDSARLHELRKPMTVLRQALEDQQRWADNYQFLMNQKLGSLDSAGQELEETGAALGLLHRELFDWSERNAKVLRQLRQIHETMHGARESQSGRIGRLGSLMQHFDDIDEVIRRIHFINDQTKLIAFNAAIEAAASGETGRRFGIVASDIRNLSQTIETSNVDMKRVVLGLRESIEAILLSAKQDAQRVLDGVGSLAEMISLIQTLQLACERHRNAAESLHRQIDQRHTTSRHFAESLHALAADTNTLTGTLRRAREHMDQAEQSLIETHR